MRTKQIVGWVLLVIGILMIGWAVFSSAQIFAGAKKPPQVFEPQPRGLEMSEAASLSDGISSDDIQKQLDKALAHQIGRILPAGAVPAALNLFAWSLFVGIVMFAGAQIANIGIKLIT